MAYFYQKSRLRGAFNSSVNSSAPSILPPQVQVPSTPSKLLSFFIKLCNVEKTKITQKEARISKKFRLKTFLQNFVFSFLLSTYLMNQTMLQTAYLTVTILVLPNELDHAVDCPFNCHNTGTAQCLMNQTMLQTAYLTVTILVLPMFKACEL